MSEPQAPQGDFKDHYATLGVAADATQAQIKRAYRKLARRFHPDVSQERDAENRFKAVAEAHEALIDPERRVAHDARALRRAQGLEDEAQGGWGAGFAHRGAAGAAGGAGPGGPAGEADFDAFVESLLRQGRGPARRTARPQPGDDQHATLMIDLMEAFHGAQREISLRLPVRDAQGRAVPTLRHLQVSIPAGVRAGQQLRLAGQGEAGLHGGPAGDLYLALQLRAHPLYRVAGRDLETDLALSPAEAALGAEVATPTPAGEVLLQVPAGAQAGARLRLRGRGLPGSPPGDLYAVLAIRCPPATTEAEQAAYRSWAAAFPAFAPRAQPAT